MAQKPKTAIVSRRHYTNEVPIADLSCPPKFVKVHFNDLERHGKCQITKLEEDYTYEVVPEDILRHCPPLVDLSLFKRLPHAEMHPLDAELLDDDFGAPIGTKRSQQHNRVVPWMRKTEYISTEFNRFGQAQDRSENKIGYSIKKSMAGQQETLYRDAASQIEAIERIFDKTNRPTKKHYKRAGVRPVEELYILPDEEEWKYSYAQVVFDGDPLPNLKDNEEVEEHAILKGMVDNENNHFVAYFAPTAETMAQLREAADDPEAEFQCNLAREFNWTIQTKASKGSDLDMFLFTQRDGRVYYNEMDTKVRLNRRVKGAGPSKEETSLIFKYRPLTEDELRAMDRRSRKLYDAWQTGERIPLDEEEEEEEEAESAGEPDRQEDSDNSDDEQPAEAQNDADARSSSGSDSADEGSAQSSSASSSGGG